MSRRMLMSKSNPNETVILNSQYINSTRWYIDSDSNFTTTTPRALKPFDFDPNLQTLYVEFVSDMTDSTIGDYIDISTISHIGTSIWAHASFIHAYYCYNGNNGRYARKNCSGIGHRDAEVITKNGVNYENIAKLSLNINDLCVSGIACKKYIKEKNAAAEYYDDETERYVDITRINLPTILNEYLDTLSNDKKLYFSSQEGSGRAKGYITIKIIDKCYSVEEMEQLTMPKRI